VSSGLPFNHAASIRSAAGLSVRAIGRDYVIGVGDCDNPRLDRYCVTDQAMWIATAIHSLMVIEHREKLAFEMPSTPQNADANFRVSFHHLPFRRVQRAVLVQDGIRDTQLADVMEEAGSSEHSLVRCRHTQLATDLYAQLSHPAVVALRLTVFDLNRRHQGTDNLNVELLVVDRNLKLEGGFQH